MTAAAGISAVFGVLTNGLDSQDMTAAAIALAGAALLACSAPRAEPALARVPRRLRHSSRAPEMRCGEFRFSTASSARHAGAFALVVLVALIAGGAWMLMERMDGSAPTRSASRTETPRRDPSSTLEGRAVAVTGDSLRFAEATVALDGIEAPERDQQCLRGDKRWRCGEAAKDALARAIRGKRVSCDLTGTTRRRDKNRTLHRARRRHCRSARARGPRVRRAEGLFSRYATEESDARRAGAGVWAGEPERPAEYRAKRWEEARRAAPEGCPIKGRVCVRLSRLCAPLVTRL